MTRQLATSIREELEGDGEQKERSRKANELIREGGVETHRSKLTVSDMSNREEVVRSNLELLQF